MHASLPLGSDEALLMAALGSDQRAWTALVERFHIRLLKIARRRCPELPNDQQKEVVQEVWAAIALRIAERGDAGYDPAVRTAISFVASFIPNAVQRVRAAYRAPGVRSRVRRPRSPTVADVAPRTGWNMRESEALDDIESVVAEAEWEHRMAIRDALIDVRRAAEIAAQPVAAAVSMVLEEGVSRADAAAAVGLSTSTLTRRLSELADALRPAA